MEKPSASTQSESLPIKANPENKAILGKVYGKVPTQGKDGIGQAGTSPRRTHNSRLDAMKRQFHRKVGKTNLTGQQRSTPNSSPKKSYLRPGQVVSKDEQDVTSLSATSASNSRLPQTLSASNFGVKGSMPVPIDKAENHQPNAKSSLTYASLRSTHTNKSDGASKNLTNMRQGRTKTRSIQVQKSVSARQVLENVLSKEMKSSTSSQNAQHQESNGTDLKSCDSSGNKSTGVRNNEAAGSKPLSSTSHFPSSNGLPSNPIASSNIREKLRQHHRQNTHVNATKQEDVGYSVEHGRSTIKTSGHEHLPNDILGTQNSTQQAESTNESILHRMRQKGPMVAKRLNQDGIDEGNGSKSQSSKQCGTISKITNKISSRPGSPRTPRRKASPGSAGRASPISKRVPSPIGKGRGRNPSPNRRPPSPSTDGVSPYSPEVTAKKVSRVLKARLYLLQQNGPNSFRIGGDSPEHKYLVIVGPQTCNCGRGQFCIHILFVMLRVFQLEPTSGLLWRRTLKNYEVETLFKAYRERCHSRIAPKKKSRVQRLVSHLANGADKHVDGASTSDDQSSSKGEEENCPICLLQMVDGESVTVCEVGCRNKLHTHCVNIWAEECKRNGGPLKCPLCRVVWKPASSQGNASMSELMVEIPPEYRELADSWIHVFGWELVSFLFSTHANVRENALRRLSHDITAALLTNNQTSASEERNSDDSDSSREGVQASSSGNSISSNMCLASCCAVLAMVCADPEYRVYITALRTFRGMMAYTQCRTDEDAEALQRLLVPVIETILLKCADSNRRTVQLSVSTVMELCRGQSGELAVGKEIATGGVVNRSVGDVKYLLSFLEFEQSPDALSWQWMLGRLNALGELFREFRTELSVSSTSSHTIEGSPAARHLMSVAKFVTFCLQNTSQPRVIKIGRKVFLHAYTLATPSPELVGQLEDMMLDLPPDINQKLTRKTAAFKNVTLNNPENSRKLIEERFRLIHSHSDDNLGDGDVLDIHSPQAPPAAPYYPLPNPSATANGPPWFQQNSQHSLPNYEHEPHYPANSYRVPHAPFANTPNYAWTPRSRDKGVIDEPSCHQHHHPPSPCTVTHPPTPPPSSVDTANLEAAIGVSLFRPIRCNSPGRDSSKPETQVPTTSAQDEDNFQEDFEYDPDMISVIAAEDEPQPPLRCFTVADAIAQGSYRPRPVAKLDSDPSLQATDQQNPSERPTRPSLLRLKSESSAFQDLSSPRSARPQTATEPRSSFSSFISGSRDRSSSHESTASSTSYTDELQQASERRRTVRELADSINRKHAKKHTKKSSNNNQGNANPSRNPKVTPPGKPHPHEMEMLPERPEPAPNETSIDPIDPCTDHMAYDGITDNCKPLCLKGAIERRGTVERYREGLRYGTPPSALRNRKVNIQKSLTEESHLVSDKKSDPLISPFHGQPQMHPVRTPARGILKNSGVQGSPVRVLSKRLGEPHDSAFATIDSGVGSELTQDSMSTHSSVSRSSKYLSSSNQLTSPECENLPDDFARYNTAARRGDMTESSKSKFSSGNSESRKSLRKQLSKSNSLPKDVLPIDIPESPTPSSDEDDRSTSPGFQRCPSAPAGSLLSDSCTESQTLFPVKDDSLVEDSPSSSTSTSAWRDQPAQTSPVRRRTPVRKLPSRPKTLAQRKKSRSKFKKQSSTQMYSSVEDLDESDQSMTEKTPVTFKSEIGVQTPSRFQEFDAHTPTSSSNNQAELSYEDDLSIQCSCRMKIEQEEDKLFAHTLAVSYVQDGLPLVPHLSFTDEENDIVRCQNEDTDSQHEYKENAQWSKGAQIGLGAFSACYQARDIFTGTLMAVKQVNHVRCSPVEERQVLHVITEEIALMRRLTHPNIVRLHGVTKEGPLYNIFVEWCAGGSVSTLLSLYGSFNEKVIVNYTLQMFRGLGYLHEQLLIHRDLKGANLLVDSTGQRLRISDFGAAARLASKGTGAGEFQGQLMGTIAFMAPEVLRGEQYGRSCDIWSAGCVITEMSSGKPPWEADKHSNHLALIFKIASAPSVPPIPESLSPALKDLCRRCLQAEPRDRPLAEELLKHPVFIKW